MSYKVPNAETLALLEVSVLRVFKGYGHGAPGTAKRIAEKPGANTLMMAMKQEAGGEALPPGRCLRPNQFILL